MRDAASAPAVIAWLSVQLAAFLALLLLASGVHKLVKRSRTETVLQGFAGVPRAAAPLAAIAAGAAEAAAGGMLWAPGHRAAGGILAAVIWSGYLGLILRAVAQGRRDADCGCTFSSARHPLGAYQIMRNLLLIVAAVLVSAGAAAGLVLPAMGSQVLAACALLALYVALDESLALAPPRTGVPA